MNDLLRTRPRPRACGERDDYVGTSATSGQRKFDSRISIASLVSAIR